MIRTLIAKLRLVIFGPVLNRFSRLTPGQVESLMLLANEGSLIKPSKSHQATPMFQIPPVQITQSLDELARLKSKVADLSERVEVLERMYHK